MAAAPARERAALRRWAGAVPGPALRQPAAPVRRLPDSGPWPPPGRAPRRPTGAVRGPVRPAPERAPGRRRAEPVRPAPRESAARESTPRRSPRPAPPRLPRPVPRPVPRWRVAPPRRAAAPGRWRRPERFRTRTGLPRFRRFPVPDRRSRDFRSGRPVRHWPRRRRLPGSPSARRAAVLRVRAGLRPDRGRRPGSPRHRCRGTRSARSGASRPRDPMRGAPGIAATRSRPDPRFRWPRGPVRHWPLQETPAAARSPGPVRTGPVPYRVRHRSGWTPTLLRLPPSGLSLVTAQLRLSPIVLPSALPPNGPGRNRPPNRRSPPPAVPALSAPETSCAGRARPGAGGSRAPSSIRCGSPPARSCRG